MISLVFIFIEYCLSVLKSVACTFQLDDLTSVKESIDLIMTGSTQELVNKGGITEMFAGLEMLRYKEPVQRQKIYFWEHTGKSIAEVDYLQVQNASIVPVKVKDVHKNINAAFQKKQGGQHLVLQTRKISL